MDGMPRVSIIMPFLNAERFIQEALDSVLAQTYTSWELLLVDDGSTDGSTSIARDHAARYPGRIRYLEHDPVDRPRASGSRDRGFAASQGEYVALLKPEDVWLPHKLEQQVPMLDAWPDAGSLYGSSLYWYSWTGEAEDRRRDYLPHLDAPLDSLLGPPTLVLKWLQGAAVVPCSCSLLMRRSAVESIGGLEDHSQIALAEQAFFTRLLLAAPIFVAAGWWSKHRRHHESSRSVVERGRQYEEWVAYLRWCSSYLTTHQMTAGELWQVLQRELWWHDRPALYRTREAGRRLRERAGLRVSRAVRERLPPSVHARLWDRRPSWRQVVSAGLDFGRLHRLTPVSRRFGFDRGQPVDRFYVENFLARRAADIHGRVLEVGDDTYTRRFGGSRISVRDVLHATEGNPKATIVADLSHADHIPSNVFDCMILTQTLHFIFDMPRAIRTLHRILKPGGVCLATVPGISQLEEGEAWYWALTVRSAQRLFGEVFGAATVEVASHGNVLVACALLQGLASQELRPQELDYQDPHYPVLITIRAVKPKE